MKLFDKKVERRLLLSQDYDFYEEASTDEGISNSTSLLNKIIPYCIEKGMDKSKLMDVLRVNPSIYYNIS